jgi:hypothetical protein
MHKFIFIYTYMRSRDSLVDIAKSSEAGRPEFDLWQGQDFSLLYWVQSETAGHPAFYAMGSGGDFIGGKANGA